MKRYPRIGILGGGQLGQMLALAGLPLGARFEFFDPNPESPAAAVGNLTVGDYSDTAALVEFAGRVDVLTYEFENVPVEAARAVAEHKPVWPPPHVLEVAQDRLTEKQFFNSLGIRTAPFAEVDSLDDLKSAVEKLKAPGILKTRRLGYDGKGQFVVRSMDDVEAAWDALSGAPLIYEGFINFDRELSVIGVRNVSGETAVYPLVENVHSEGILRLSTAPAQDVSDELQQQASSYMTDVLNRFNYVGVLAVELFDTDEGLVANEMAPRVHNSGHWTIEGADVSQFENHIRAVLDLPLGPTTTRGYSAMWNLIGNAPSPAAILELPSAHLHLYGKTDAPRRKIGHITVHAAERSEVDSAVHHLRRILAASTAR